MTEARLRAAIAALALLGTAIAAYLTYTRYSGAQIACATGGCETVQQSSYAKVAGIPVAVLGLVAYAALFLTALRREPAAAAVGAGLALVGVAFSGYLLYAQLGPIDAICQWCVANDAIIVLLAIAALARLRLAQNTTDAVRQIQ